MRDPGDVNWNWLIILIIIGSIVKIISGIL